MGVTRVSEEYEELLGVCIGIGGFGWVKGGKHGLFEYFGKFIRIQKS